MLFADRLVVLRGGGDLATGVAARLHRSGFPVIVLELAQPLTVRRTVALSSAVAEGRVQIEDLEGVAVGSGGEAAHVAPTGAIPVLVSPGVPALPRPISVLVDARMAKRNIDTAMDQAPLVVALGPGFTAGVDCHVVVETMRGPDLGRVIREGAAAADTGVPGRIGGEEGRRVLRAPGDGEVRWDAAITDLVAEGEELGHVGEMPVVAGVSGVVRGLLAEGTMARAGMKLGDVDPRADPELCHRISDKSLAVGGGVLEAVLAWLDRQS